MRINRLNSKILQQIKEHIAPGSGMIVACSGGADSIVLADALASLKDSQSYKVIVVHVEHGLRGEEALLDAEFVKEFCAKRGLPFILKHVDVQKFADEAKASVEDAARQLRYGALSECAREHHVDMIVTAHHRGDQAETLLLHLVRGSGLDGLSGMRSFNGNIYRPLLKISRKEIEKYCQINALKYCQDSSNANLEFTRNRLRHVLVPLLKKEFNNEIESCLAQTTEILALDAEYLNDCTRLLIKEHVFEEGLNKTCDTKWLLSLPKALAFRVIRFMWQGLQVESVLTYKHTKSIFDLADSGVSNKIIMLPGNSWAKYSYNKLIMSKNFTESCLPQEFITEKIIKLEELKKNGKLLVELETLKIRFSYLKQSEMPTGVFAFPINLITENHVCIRTRRDGDYFLPANSNGTKKIKKYFSDKKIPLDERSKKIFVAFGSQIIYIVGDQGSGWKNNAGDEWLTITCTDLGDENNEH